jgi:hypothetical protein
MSPWTTVLGVAGIATLTIGTGAAPALVSQPVPEAHASACLSEPPVTSTHMVPAVGDAHDGRTLCDRVYAVNNMSTDGSRWTVSLIDPDSMRVVEDIPVGPQPHHIYPVPDRNIAYISHLAGNGLDVLDMVSNQVVGRVATGSGPRSVASPTTT